MLHRRDCELERGTSAAIGLDRSTLTPEEVARREASVFYSGCNEARAAGAAPVYAGQPGYRADMDGDGDGIACEPHRRF